ncbi:MAG: MmcQ/YjbR family DNA-binding protein [Miniphocaeibacter sp.]|uniref:MmcQ/YjbR family DNA-binding protein n=1 Tax=Miniphocaeibacter sp. TaxID=3100973 RepID=UPI0017C0F50B|nr:MmcQ/YjbR family DNA-binding protein [Gallicola sp.]
MDIEGRKNEFIEFGKTLLGADVYYRDSWECDYFSINGKCFGMMTKDLITLKNKPEDILAMRDLYSDVSPGYYANKKHWNSINLNTEQLSNEEIKNLIEISYNLVFDKLTKKEKNSILEGK